MVERIEKISSSEEDDHSDSDSISEEDDEEIQQKYEAYSNSLLSQLGVSVSKPPPAYSTPLEKRKKLPTSSHPPVTFTSDLSLTTTAPSSKPEKRKNEPTCVVFNDPTHPNSQRFSGPSKKKFLSSKISKIFDDDTLESAKNLKDQDESKDDEANKILDRELNNIIATSRLLEEYQASELQGKERKKFMRNQLHAAGVKSEMKQPKNLGIQTFAKQVRRENNQLQKAKDDGLYHSSLKNLYQKTAKSKRKSKSAFRSDRGLKETIGRFKNGVLHISKDKLKR